MRIPRLPARSSGDPSFWGTKRSYAERYQWGFVLASFLIALLLTMETVRTWAPPHPNPVTVSARVVSSECVGRPCVQVADVVWQRDGTEYEGRIRAPDGFAAGSTVSLHQHPEDPSTVWSPGYYNPPALLFWANGLAVLALLAAIGHVVWRHLPREEAPPPRRVRREPPRKGPPPGQGRRARRRGRGRQGRQQTPPTRVQVGPEGWPGGQVTRSADGRGWPSALRVVQPWVRGFGSVR